LAPLQFRSAAGRLWAVRLLADMTEPQLSRKANLVLIGYRATGKSSVGAALARRLNRPLVDLDEVLVAEAGCTIADLVARSGWEEFRRREKELARRFGKRSGQVLATGGGVVLDLENVAVLRENGLLIWLKAEPAAIRERLGLDDATFAFRPSLTGADTLAEVDRVLAEREPRYQAAAHIVIDTTGLSVSDVVEQILAAVRRGNVKAMP
jgi:shikimate kinase